VASVVLAEKLGLRSIAMLIDRHDAETTEKVMG